MNFRLVFCLTLVASFALLGNAVGSEIILMNFTCPMDSTTFEDRVQVSCYIDNRMLDLQEIGAVCSPPPLPVCPKDHFVVYSDSFPPAVLETLRPYIASREYQHEAADHVSYYLMARILEHLQARPMNVAWAYLQASWQARENAPRHRLYASRCLVFLLRALETPGGGVTDSTTAQVLAAELGRQLGDFSAAHSRLERLQAAGRLDPKVSRVVERELELIAARDSLRHECPR